jgi:hypothetical protein
MDSEGANGPLGWWTDAAVTAPAEELRFRDDITFFDKLSWMTESKKKSNATSFSGSMMIVADDSCDLPCTVFVLPQVNELRFANALLVVISRVMKAMDTHFDRT